MLAQIDRMVDDEVLNTQADLFADFVGTLKEHCEPRQLHSQTDYRQAAAAAAAAVAAAAAAEGRAVSDLQTVFCPAGEESWARLSALLGTDLGTYPGSSRAAGAPPSEPGSAGITAVEIPVLFGRRLSVRTAGSDGGVALFDFEELCLRPLGAADYLALSERFHTVAVHSVPQARVPPRERASLLRASIRTAPITHSKHSVEA